MNVFARKPRTTQPENTKYTKQKDDEFITTEAPTHREKTL
jgi:hypothetical protein